eukprot:Opistho-1_new@61670
MGKGRGADGLYPKVDAEEETKCDDPLLGAMNSAPTQYILYRSRWLMLFIVCVLNISNAALWISFSPIADITSAYYDRSLTLVNLLSQIFMICYLPLGFTSSWALDDKGLRYGVLIGAVLNFVGAWVRYVSDFVPGRDGSFGVLFVGQTLAACAQPFILNAPTKLAAVWFGEKERATANTIASVSNPLGVAIASVLAPAIVDQGKDIATMNWIFAIPASVALVIAVAFLRAEPPTHPSASAEDVSDSFMVGLRKLARNRHYLLLLTAFGIGVGIFNAVSTLLEQIVRPHGYDKDDAGLLGALVIGFGLVGAGVTGPLVDKTRRYKEVLKVAFVAAVGTFIWFALASRHSGAFVPLAASCALMGVCCFSILPVCLELSVECTYPISEGTSAGFLWMAGQVFGVAFIFAMNGLKSGPTEDMDHSNWFMVGMAGIAMIAALLFNGNYHRVDHEFRRASLASETQYRTSSPSSRSPATSNASVTVTVEYGTGADKP